MIEAKKAQFKFSNYTIPKFSFDGLANHDTGLKIQFEPSGMYEEKEGVFHLYLNFIGKKDNEQNEVVVNVSSIAVFNFQPELPFSEIPEFFYKNSIAIFFPYLRSFLSTLSLQANTRLILLDLMNLTDLSDIFKANTKCKNDLDENIN